jgi:hypothetical protein
MGALASVTVPEHPEHPPTIWPWFSSFWSNVEAVQGWLGGRKRNRRNDLD